MEEIILVAPTMEYADQIEKFREEILEANDGDAFAGCSNLQECVTAEKWIDEVTAMEKPETCPEGYVTANTYLAVRKADNRLIGVIDLRHHINNPVLSLWGGHMGYTIRPSDRQKGYGKEMLRQNLEKCRERGMEKVMITCFRWNEASERTILANGGVFEKEIFELGEYIKRFWVTL